jgi:16S rRNA (uracil1498-N3)-methyltransferase
MGLARFFASELPSQGTVRLDESESHHAVRVLRIQVGDDVLVFDGLGNEGFGTVVSISKKQIAIEVKGKRFAPRDHDGKLVLAIAMPKGDRQRSVIEKLVELGVDILIPIDTERSVAKLDAAGIERLERYALDSCKQCCRNRLLHIEPCIPFSELLRSNRFSRDADRWLVHPGPEGVAMEEFLNPWPQQTIVPPPGEPHREVVETMVPTRTVVFAIGPEGGFSPSEVSASAQAGFRTLNLGDRILRVETAVAAVSVLGHLRTCYPTGVCRPREL